MKEMRCIVSALAAVTLLMFAGCAGSIRALQGEGAAALPDTIAINTTPARLIAGETATFAAVADVSRPHGAVAYKWNLDGLGTRAGSHVDDIVVGTIGTDREITVALADLPVGESSRTYACSVTIELTEEDTVTSHTYPFTVTVFSS